MGGGVAGGSDAGGEGTNWLTKKWSKLVERHQGVHPVRGEKGDGRGAGVIGSNGNQEELRIVKEHKAVHHTRRVGVLDTSSIHEKQCIALGAPLVPPWRGGGREKACMSGVDDACPCASLTRQGFGGV